MGHLLTLVWFEVRVQLRRSSFWLALVILLVPVILGLIMQHGRFASSFFGYGYVASLALRLTIHLAEDRQCGHDLLMSNFAAPAQRLAAKVAGLLVREILFLLVSTVLAVLAGQSLRLGLWYSTLFTLVALLLLPLALLVEFVTDVRAPGAVALLAGAATLFVALQLADARSVFVWIGFPQAVGGFGSLGRLAMMAAGALTVSLMLCSTWVLARGEARA